MIFKQIYAPTVMQAMHEQTASWDLYRDAETLYIPIGHPREVRHPYRQI